MTALLYSYNGQLAQINDNNACNDVGGNLDANSPNYSPPPCSVKVKPDLTGVDTSQMVEIANSLMWLALVAALITFLASVALMVFSQYTDNQESQFNSRRGALAGVLASFFIGALPFMIRFWVGVGSGGN